MDLKGQQRRNWVDHEEEDKKVRMDLKSQRQQGKRQGSRGVGQLKEEQAMMLNTQFPPQLQEGQIMR